MAVVGRDATQPTFSHRSNRVKDFSPELNADLLDHRFGTGQTHAVL